MSLEKKSVCVCIWHSEDCRLLNLAMFFSYDIYWYPLWWKSWSCSSFALSFCWTEFSDCVPFSYWYVGIYFLFWLKQDKNMAGVKIKLGKRSNPFYKLQRTAKIRIYVIQQLSLQTRIETQIYYYLFFFSASTQKQRESVGNSAK